MTPADLRLSILKRAFSGTFFGGSEWNADDDSLFKSLWEITYWDKKFQNVDKNKQKKIINYKHVLAGDFRNLEVEGGDVFLLSTGLYSGYTSTSKLGFQPSCGEIISIPGGGSASVKYFNGKFVTSDNRIATSVNTKLYDNKYIYYFLFSSVRELEKMYRGTSLKHPDMSLVLEMKVPVPKIEEQKRIVAKIEELLPLVDKYEEVWTKMKRLNNQFPFSMENSILQQAVEGKLVKQMPSEGTGKTLYEKIKSEKTKLLKNKQIRLQKQLPDISEDEIPFKIPDSWCWVRAQDITSILTCGYASTPKYETNGIPFISAKNVKPYKFIFSDYKYISENLYRTIHCSYEPQRGDILLTRVGAGIGEACIVDNDEKFGIYVSVTLMRMVIGDMNKFFLYLLQSPYGMKLSKKFTSGVGASQGNLNVNDVRKFLVPLPPLEEQKRIVAKIEELLPLCKSLQK